MPFESNAIFFGVNWLPVAVADMWESNASCETCSSFAGANFDCIHSNSGFSVVWPQWLRLHFCSWGKNHLLESSSQYTLKRNGQGILSIEVGKLSYCVRFTVVYKLWGPFPWRSSFYVSVEVTSYLSARHRTRVSSAVWVISPRVLHV